MAAPHDRPGFPASPCVSLCTLDDDNRCLGCGRSLDQISRWSLMGKKEQWAIIDQLAARGRANALQSPRTMEN